MGFDPPWNGVVKYTCIFIYYSIKTDWATIDYLYYIYLLIYLLSTIT